MTTQAEKEKDAFGYRPLPLQEAQRMSRQKRTPKHSLGALCKFSSLLFKTVLTLVAILLLVIVVSSVMRHIEEGKADYSVKLLHERFEEFQRSYARNYATEQERLERFSIFAENVRQLEKRIHAENGGETEWGVTEFFDWNEQEVKQLLCPLEGPGTKIRTKAIRNFRPKPSYRRPKEFDWRKKGVISHVKNQLKCGACWAFATAAVVESQHAIHNRTLVTLSEQQLIDCDKSNNGCEGGYRPNALRYVRDNGLLPDSAYPFQGKDGSCNLPPGPVDPTSRVFIDEFRRLPSDEGQIADWIVEKGPVSFGLNVTQGMLQYRGGIFSPTPEECSQRAVGSHAMEVVGFGESPDTGTRFWIMKNSWGAAYGINGGYLHMRRDVNACGLTREVLAAIITRY